MMLNRPAIVRLFAAICLIMVTACQGWAATYYVTQTAQGTRDGSSYDNSMSLASCNSATFAAGDEVYICDTITSHINARGSGTIDSRLVYRGDLPGHPGIIDLQAASDYGFYSSINNYLTVLNLTIKNNTGSQPGISLLPQAIYTTIDGCDISSVRYGVRGIPKNLTVTNSKIHDCREQGLWGNTYSTDPYQVVNVNISYNEIYNNALGAIKYNNYTSTYNMSGWIVSHNDIHDNLSGISLSNFDNSSGLNYISNNICYDNGLTSAVDSNGLWFGYCSYLIIQDNICYNNATGGIDGGGIMLDHDSNNCIIRRNICYNHDSCHDQVPWGVGSAGNSSGIMVFMGANNNKIYNNICYNNAVGYYTSDANTADNEVYNNVFAGNRIGVQGDLRAGATGNILKNNIIANNTKTGDGVTTNWDVYIDDTSVETITDDYNCFSATPDFYNFTKGTHSFHADPLFFDASANDYRLRFDSPCRWAGTPISGLTTDYAGNYISPNHPDIGAYQYQPSICKHIINHHPSKQRIIREVIQ